MSKRRQKERRQRKRRKQIINEMHANEAQHRCYTRKENKTIKKLMQYKIKKKGRRQIKRDRQKETDKKRQIKGDR